MGYVCAPLGATVGAASQAISEQAFTLADRCAKHMRLWRNGPLARSSWRGRGNLNDPQVKPIFIVTMPLPQ
jgi:hypothetical protein